jgi:hypothetical protein
MKDVMPEKSWTPLTEDDFNSEDSNVADIYVTSSSNY